MALAQTLDNIKARAAFREVSDGVYITAGTEFGRAQRSTSDLAGWLEDWKEGHKHT
jgi:hypothetical protein